MNTSAASLSQPAFLSRLSRLPRVTPALMFALALMVLAFTAISANNNGVALQAAYNTLNDMVNGFGKQLLTVMGFIVAAIGFIASNATSVIMKFVGYAIFLGVGLAAAVTLVGAVI